MTIKWYVDNREWLDKIKEKNIKEKRANEKTRL
jgi:dTDP-D-glucose 4,6-dehydratase